MTKQKSQQKNKGGENLDKVIASKYTGIGMVEIRFNGSMYQLYINGSMSKQSSDYDYIRSEFEKM